MRHRAECRFHSYRCSRPVLPGRSCGRMAHHQSQVHRTAPCRNHRVERKSRNSRYSRTHRARTCYRRIDHQLALRRTRGYTPARAGHNGCSSRCNSIRQGHKWPHCTARAGRVRLSKQYRGERTGRRSSGNMLSLRGRAWLRTGCSQRARRCQSSRRRLHLDRSHLLGCQHMCSPVSRESQLSRRTSHQELRSGLSPAARRATPPQPRPTPFP